MHQRGEISAPTDGRCYDPCVAVRSQPIALTPVRTKTGRVTYRVTGTINGKQKKQQCLSLEDAEAVRDSWEMARISGAAALRPKVTRLMKSQLEEAEACFLMLADSGFTLRDAVKALLRNPPPKLCELTFAEACDQFIEWKTGQISDTHCANYGSPMRRLGAFLGANTKVCDITTDHVHAWLKSLKVSKKSWNNYRGDLICVFNWFAGDPQNWITKNPVVAVPRFRKRDTLPPPIEAMSVEQVKGFLAWLEIAHPKWVIAFAIAVFAGVRPDRNKGEMGKLATAIERDGLNAYFRSDTLRITKEISKDGRPRTIPLPSNLLSWIQRYPVTPEALRGGNANEYAAIRARWSIPHDGLRHTSMSASAALHGITEAVVRHGNSERICLDHYMNLMTKEAAAEFYSIRPTAPSDTDSMA